MDPVTAAESPAGAEAGEPPRIVVVEDSEPDVFLIREALQAAGISSAGITVVDDGEKAIRAFRQTDANPELRTADLVILDINLPKKQGGDVLRCIRASARSVAARVLIVTSSDSERDRAEMFQLGANGYFRKPSNFAEFMKLGQVARAMLGPTSAPSTP